MKEEFGIQRIAMLLFIIALIFPSKPLIINCTFQSNIEWGYGCEGKVTFNDKSDNVQDEDCMITWTSTHEDGKSDDEVKFLKLQSYDLRQLPARIGNKFINLEILCLDTPKLKQIHYEDLKDLKKMKRLEIPQSMIKHIPLDLFNNTLKISHLIIKSKAMEFVDKNAFGPVSNTLKEFQVDFTCTGGKKMAKSNDEINELIEYLNTNCSSIDNDYRPKKEFEGCSELEIIVETSTEAILAPESSSIKSIVFIVVVLIILCIVIYRCYRNCTE